MSSAQGDETELSQQLLWFKIFLARTDTIPEEEKKKVEERLDVFEQLLEESSVSQRLRERARRKELAEGELLSLREVLVGIVSVQHPTLQELAQERVRHIKQPDVLYELINMLLIGLNEKSIYAILTNPPTRLSEYT